MVYKPTYIHCSLEKARMLRLRTKMQERMRKQARLLGRDETESISITAAET